MINRMKEKRQKKESFHDHVFEGLGETNANNIGAINHISENMMLMSCDISYIW